MTMFLCAFSVDLFLKKYLENVCYKTNKWIRFPNHPSQIQGHVRCILDDSSTPGPETE